MAEAENLDLIEDIIKLVAENQALEPNETFNQVKQFLFNKFKEEYDLQRPETSMMLFAMVLNVLLI